MTAISKQRLTLAVSLPALIFLACIMITFTATFKAHAGQLTVPLLLDLLLTAPFLYFLVIRKSSVPKITVLRVCMTGVLIATAILSGSKMEIFAVIKTWVSPLVEITLIGFIAWKFFTAGKRLKGTDQQHDFLTYCRAVLQSASGSKKLANVFASEIAVFYYAFRKKDRGIDYKTKFTCYRENGILLVLSTFLALFLIESVGMHFIFLLWSKTAAWILTIISLYTCLQLFAHIRALQSRPIHITNTQVYLRNGLLGGDVVVPFDNIAKIERSSKLYPAEANAVQLAFIKGLENHNTAIHLVHSVEVIKAFGIRKNAKVILVHVDKQEAFMERMKNYTNNPVQS